MTQNDDLTQTNIDSMEQALHYLKYAQGKGDEAYIKQDTFGNLSVTIKVRKKDVVKDK